MLAHRLLVCLRHRHHCPQGVAGELIGIDIEGQALSRDDVREVYFVYTRVQVYTMRKQMHQPTTTALRPGYVTLRSGSNFR